VTLPVPAPGLVIRYAYLWEREAREGRDEGSKDRPCAIVLVTADAAGRRRVQVLPVTHSPPRTPADAVEIPAQTKARLGLDGERSRVVVTEVNEFTWPGPDLRTLGSDAATVAFGFLPPGFFRVVRDRYLALQRRHRVSRVPRSE
jgi:hypothetical protein